MADTHILRRFGSGMEAVSGQLTRMGELAQAQLAAALQLLREMDEAQARDIIGEDATLNQWELQVNDDIIALIARHNPMADDLRRLVVALKIANMLERMGDYAKSIAKRAARARPADANDKALLLVQQMGDKVMQQVTQIFTAYQSEDADLALKVWHADSEVDALLDDLFTVALSNIAAQKGADSTVYAHLLFVAKNLERVGDYTTNIAEEVYYLVHGQLLVRAVRKSSA